MTVYRGNIDAIYPNSPEAQLRKSTGQSTDAPFLSPARIFELPESPDFLSAGDFDADGHWDLAAGALGSTRLYLLRGDGHGGFAAPESVSLAGAITAMIGGEAGRPDGLIDLVLALRSAHGAQLAIFQGPEGALCTKPEAIPLPAEANELALGRFYGGPFIDLAAALGSRLVLVRG